MPRSILFFASLIALVFDLLGSNLAAQNAVAPLPSDHKRVTYYIDAQGRELPVTNVETWQRRRKQILAGAELAMGPLPKIDHALPLDIKVLEEIVQEGVRRQSISYVVEGERRCTAYLWIPETKAPQRRRAMLALHPTGPLGKGIVAGLGPRANRGYGFELAQRGYVVLAPDYPSFGDLKDYDFEKDSYVSGTMTAIVNHMRGVDLLQQRADVDPNKIGAIGHSLGGHNAIFVGVFDERIKVVVTSCGWCPFHDYYGGKIVGWTSNRYMPLLKEKYELNSDRVPFDFYELVSALAPRAFFTVSPLRDSNFDYRGVQKAMPEVAKIYSLYGALDQQQVRYPDCEHDFPDDMRQEVYRFIDRTFERE